MPGDSRGGDGSDGAQAVPALDESVDALYALPLPDFTSARNDLSKRLRTSGDRSGADAVKALRKPSLTAWAVNQVVHHYPGEWNSVLQATARVRKAHATGVGALGDAIATRKAALADAQEAAVGVLRRAGSSPTGPQSRKVAASLEALAGGANDVRPGRLVVDLEPLGFGGLAGLELAVPAARPPRQALTSPAQPRSRKRAAETETTHTSKTPAPESGPTPDSLAQAARIQAEANKARAAAERARVAALKAEERYAQARAAVEELGQAHTEAARQAEEASHATDAARQAAEAARARHLEAQSAQAGLERRLKRLAADTASAQASMEAAEARMLAAQARLQALEEDGPS